VGKSTTAVSIGAALAEIGHKVLVVDLDPQGNASTGLGIRHEARDVTVYDVLAAEAPIEGAVVETPVEGLHAIPSTIDLAGAEIELVSQFSRELRLRRALEPLRSAGYDFVFLDCPPSLGLLTVNALAAAEELIVPIQCEYYALEGLGQLLRNVGLVQQNVNPSLRLTGIVMTMYDPRTRLSEQVVAEVRRYFGKRVYKTVIPRTVRLSEAPGFGQPITVYDPSSRGAESYRELAREVARRQPSDEPLPHLEELRVSAPPEPEPVTAPRALGPREAPLAAEEPEVLEPPTVELEPSGRPSAPVEPPEAEPAPVGEPVSEPAPEGDGEGATPPLIEVAAGAPTGSVMDVTGSSSPLHAPGEEDVERAAGERSPSEGQAPTGAPDRDGTEAWIEAVEAEARSEAEAPSPTPTAPPVREIDLESEAEPAGTVEPTEVIRIEDRDAAGEHEPVGEAEKDGASGKRRWTLFRRGGSR